jgi:pimeloyl-ACP methyl ester carboxylesterase
MVVKNYAWLMLFILLLAGGCNEEKDIVPTSTDVDKVTDLQTVKTVSGITTEFGCTVETYKTGEIIEICKPANWNGELTIYAHGYVSAYEPLALPTQEDEFAPLFISMGYAYATTSYSENGLAIQSGIDDILDLRKKFIKEYGEPEHIYLTGGSEGGLVTTLAIERYPELFSGGLSLCGPCGDFQKQINYYADFRVLFDYYFPGILPGDAVNIPDDLINNWATIYWPAILQAITQNPAAAYKILNITGAAYDPNNITTIGKTFERALWYDVFATNDAIEKLKGQPYDNTTTIYTGTGSAQEDAQLNALVDRFEADKHALKNIEKYYQTTGDLTIPLVKAHTTGDPVVPFWHLPLYQAKVVAQGTTQLFAGLPVNRYGHCTFTEAEIVTAFALLAQKVKGQTLTLAEQLIAQAKNGKIVQSVHTARR